MSEQVNYALTVRDSPSFFTRSPVVPFTVSLQRLRLLDSLFDRTDHVERLLGQVIVLAVDDCLEAADRVLECHVLAGRPRKCFRDVERLRQEALDLARARDGELVFGRELVHPEDRDDVAQLLVALQGLLDAPRDRVVLLANNMRIELTRRRIERIDRRIDAERS